MSFKKPLIIKRDQLRSSQVLKNKNSLINFFNRSTKTTIPIYREDVIYDSMVDRSLKGDFQRITIVNRLNNLTNACRTIAKLTFENTVIEKTSDNITKVIGQENYNTLFHALCSVINNDSKVKAVLALLTVNVDNVINTNPKSVPKLTINQASQTDETRLILKKKRERKRVRKSLTPFVVQEEKIVKKIVIDPQLYLQNLKVNEEQILKVKEEPSFENVEVEIVEEPLSSSVSSISELPDLGNIQDENSNDSAQTCSSLHTFNTLPGLMINPLSLVNNIDQNTKDNEKFPNIQITSPDHPVSLSNNVDQLPKENKNFSKDLNSLPNHTIMLMDKSVVRVPFKPEDDLHIATMENLQFLNECDRKKLLMLQMQIDYRCCTTLKDEDGNLPIHSAVATDDIELLKRQCVVLKLRNQTVDITANEGMTALKLSLFRESTTATSVLLQHGADATLTDADHSTSLHLAAELNTDHLSVIIHHCRLHARGIIYQHVDELVTPGWENLTDHQLSEKLLNHVCCAVFDKQGNNPLILASKLGLYENVRLLLDAAPTAVNIQNPNSGNTALYVAVTAAVTASAERGNKSKVVDHFRKTIEYLLEHGADPGIDNHANSNVNLLLTDISCAELSMLIANKVVNTKYFNGDVTQIKNCDAFMLIKNSCGNVNLQNISGKIFKRNVKTDIIIQSDVRRKRKLHNKTIILQNVPAKPIIVENILLKPPRPNKPEPIPKSSNSKNIIIKMNDKMAEKKAGNEIETKLLPEMRRLIVSPMKRKSDAEIKPKKIKKLKKI